MKNTFSSILFLTILSLFVACKKKEAVGPQGPEGASSLMKQGSVTGTLYGKSWYTEDTIIQSFQFEYFTNYADQSSFYDGDGVRLEFTRRSPNNDKSFFEFSANLNNVTDELQPENVSIAFQLEKALSDSTFLTFYDRGNLSRLDFNYSGSKLKLDNYSFNSTTGQLKFDYEIDMVTYENSTYNPAVLKGSVDVNLKKEIQ